MRDYARLRRDCRDQLGGQGRDAAASGGRSLHATSQPASNQPASNSQQPAKSQPAAAGLATEPGPGSSTLTEVGCPYQRAGRQAEVLTDPSQARRKRETKYTTSEGLRVSNASRYAEAAAVLSGRCTANALYLTLARQRPGLHCGCLPRQALISS